MLVLIAGGCSEPTDPPFPVGTRAEPPPPARPIAVAPRDTTVQPGARFLLRADAAQTAGVTGLTWRSQNTNVATVGSDGTVTLVGLGSVGIVLTGMRGSEPVRGAATVRVEGPLAVGDGGALIDGSTSHACAIAADAQLFCWGDNAYGQLGNGSFVRPDAPARVVGDHRFTAVSVGYNRTCALDDQGRALCWGDGTADLYRWSTARPQVVEGAPRFRTIATAGENTCGITDQHDAYCWGEGRGSIGDGSAEGSAVPVLVAGGLEFQATARGAGGNHNCGITVAGEAFCWGRNIGGTLGDGTTVDSPTPVRVQTDQRFVSIALGVHDYRGYTCGLTTEGLVYCWGANAYDMFGAGASGSLVPRQVMDGQRYSAIRAGTRLCLLDMDGAMTCREQGYTGTAVDGKHVALALGPAPCGYGFDGIVRCGWQATPMVATVLPADSTIARVDIDAPHFYVRRGATRRFAADARGTGWVVLTNVETRWATDDPTIASVDPSTGIVSGHRHGIVTLAAGAGNATASAKVLVTPDQPISWERLTVSGSRTCALTAEFHTYCWGNDPRPEFLAPVPTMFERSFVRYAIGGQHTCALDPAGEAYCWGAYQFGQLGNDSKAPVTGIVKVLGGHRFVELVAGDLHTCGLKQGGEVYCWGYGYTRTEVYRGWVDDGNTWTVPTRFGETLLFREISAGSTHTCGIVLSGEVYCWGSWAQLGAGQYGLEASIVPVLLAGGHRYTHLSAGSFVTCATASDGRTLCWDRFAPEPVQTAVRFTRLAAGEGAAVICGLDAADAAYCWGWGDPSMFGAGSGLTTTTYAEPVRVAGGHAFESISVGRQHACALATTGKAYCWGVGGLLGDGTSATSGVPVPVSAPLP